MNRSASAVTLKEDRRSVLLHLRGDVRLWSLPGGRIEPDEGWEDAAVRETYEETGYWIAIERLVGENRRPQLPDTKRVFLGHVVGGAPVLHPPETVRLAWVPVDRLPWNRLTWLREYVHDALSPTTEPVRRIQYQSHVQRLVMRGVLELHDLHNRLGGRT